MKWMVALGVVLIGVGVFVFRKRQWSKAEEALVHSVCSQEMDVIAHVNVAKKLMADGDKLSSGVQAVRIKAELKQSSLAPHLSALHRMADHSDHLAHVKRLAVVASARCPEVFAEPIKAEKPLGYSIQLSKWTLNPDPF